MVMAPKSETPETPQEVWTKRSPPWHRPKGCWTASIRCATGWEAGGPFQSVTTALRPTRWPWSTLPFQHRSGRAASGPETSLRTRRRWPRGRNPEDRQPARPVAAASPDAGGWAIGPRRPSHRPGPARTEPRWPPPPMPKGPRQSAGPHREEGRWSRRSPRCHRAPTSLPMWLRMVPRRTQHRSAETPRQATPSALPSTTGTPWKAGDPREGKATAARVATAGMQGQSHRGMSPLGSAGKPAVDRRCLPLRPRREEAYLRAPCGRGGIGRHARFRIWCRKAWGFESLRPHIVPHTSTTTWKSPRRTSTR